MSSKPKKGQFFYAQLAAGNIRKNGKIYLPYLLTCILTVTMFYLVLSLSQNPGLMHMPGSVTSTMVLCLGAIITAIFAVIFLFYTNSFLMKRRKKEFGLYNILGMEKRHLARVVFYETFYILLLSLSAGLGLGLLLDKLMYLGFVNLIGGEITLGFHFSGSVLIITILLFCLIFGVILGNSLFQIARATPLALLQGGSVGEKEPRAKWVLTLLGLLFLGLGYYCSLTIDDPMVGVVLFFWAVLLVIAGTYLLFTAGSITLLKLLRKNKRYYYKPRNFISISGMIYRMKQNAIGLGNVCVLSTMVLVMVSSSLCLWLGAEEMYHNRYPRDILFAATQEDAEAFTKACAQMPQLVTENDLTLTDLLDFQHLDYTAFLEGEAFLVPEEDTTLQRTPAVVVLFPLEDFNRINGTTKTLAPDEVFLYGNRTAFPHKTMTLFDQRFHIKEILTSVLEVRTSAANVSDSYYVVLPESSPLTAFSEKLSEIRGSGTTSISLEYGFNLVGTEQNKEAFYAAFPALSPPGYYEVKSANRTEFLGLFGGFFFLGLFLGSLFTMATILIIYYKQISEGYDDQVRFDVMQKLGMEHREVKGAIRTQILTMFFLPLATAGLHVAVAFPFIALLLRAFSLTNTLLFLQCTLGSFLGFTLLYAVVYALTAKVYYKIVKR